ncbi:MAG: helicase-exonuclease AddAB subunit AddA [Oscillospiraceae bacterium]|nr:helicase-exonuclease AddAB subunit AddA [Oscillospiraceae bacterium]
MFQPTKQQEEAIVARGSSLLVSAAAGSGKTKVLVERLMARLTEETDPCQIQEFLIITYTRAAAAELRGKIIEEMAERLAADPQNRHLQRQSQLVYQAEIKTIHSFCQRLLRQNAHGLGLDPDFRVGEETECLLLRRRVVNQVLEEWYQSQPEKAPFYALVDLYSAGPNDEQLVEIILNTEEKLQSHPDPEKWRTEQMAALTLPEGMDAGETIWGQLLLQDGISQCAYWEREMQRAYHLLLEDEKLSKGYADSFQATIAGLQNLQAAMKQGWTAAEKAVSQEFFPRLGAVRGCENPLLQEQVKQIRAQCKKRLEFLQARFSTSGETLLDDMRAVAPVIGVLFQLVTAFERAYTAEKRRRRMLDFSDLEHLALRALLDPETGGPTELARETQMRYREIMVDEYQDVNGVQDAIFHALSRNGQNLFFVGDVKQSIYRFRLADPTLFLEKYRAFAPYEQASEGESRRIVLSQNFRSRREVLAGVNFLFRNIMSEELGEMAYTDTEALYPGAVYPDGPDTRVELQVLQWDEENAEPEEEERPGRTEVEANAAAARIEALLGEKFPVYDRETEQMRPVRPSDIVILLRSPHPVLQYYTRALGKRNIPFVTEGGDGFLSAVEIAVVLSLLRILDNPRQDIPLISVLRSPLFGFSSDRLAEIRLCAPDADFYDALAAAAETMADCSSFLQALHEMRQHAMELPLDRLLWQLYNRWNILSVFGALPGGALRQKNLILFTEYAGQFAKSGQKSLFDFLTYVQWMEENGKDFAPSGDQAGEGVRIMSIHKSKGLEYPVVLLAGLSKRFNATDLRKPILVHPALGVGPKWLDRERLVEMPTLARMAVAHQLDRELRSEEMRLLYVAMTRAKEKLILLCSVSGGRELRQYGMAARQPMDPQVLAAAPSMAGWILPVLMTRPEAGALRDAAELPQMMPTPDDSPAWDISFQMFSQDDKREENETDREDSAETSDWTERPEARRARPAYRPFFVYPHLAADRPSKLTATDLKGRRLDQEAAEDTPVHWQKPVYRPRFAMEQQGLTPAERGTALHLAMQFLDYTRTDTVAAVEKELERMKAMALLTAEQAAAVRPEKIVKLFSSPLGKRLSGGDCKREFKFSILVPAETYYPEAKGEQVLLQGVIDCYFEEADGITVVDFKTDYVPRGEEAEVAAKYTGQLEIYQKALEMITGKPVRHRILYFFSTNRSWEWKESLLGGAGAGEKKEK